MKKDLKPIVERANEARSAVEIFRKTKAAIQGDRDLSDEAKTRRTLEARTTARGALTDVAAVMRRQAAAVFEDSKMRLLEAKRLDPAELQSRAAVLGPILANIRPMALIDVYRDRFRNPLDRHILEEAASLLTLSLRPEDGNVRFTETFLRAQQELRAQLPEAEREALAGIEIGQEVLDYVERVAFVAEHDLRSAAGERIEASENIRRTSLHHAAEIEVEQGLRERPMWA